MNTQTGKQMIHHTLKQIDALIKNKKLEALNLTDEYNEAYTLILCDLQDLKRYRAAECKRLNEGLRQF